MGNASKPGGITVHPSPIAHCPSPSFKALPPLSLYIHIPWCVKKCPYCDFNSHEARAAVPEERYVAALVADLEHALPAVWGRRVQTVFLGGGTPSLFSARSIDAILAAARARLALAADAEITLEANPGTVEAEKFRDFAAAGVNRLSLGIQSFDPRHLRALGRIHDGEEARRAINIAQRNFANINLDLMYGLPGQSPNEAVADVEAALGFNPSHLSCYHLTLEPNTYFHRFPPALPDDDATAAMQEEIETRLAAAGYEHYETSAFARRVVSRRVTPSGGPEGALSAVTDARCRHNLNYWQFGDYLGIGAGAHGKLSFPDRITREVRVKHPERYLEAAERGTAVDDRHDVATHALGFEFMMNALRLNHGFASRLFEERAGIPLVCVRKELDEAERRGLIERDHERIAPSPLGRRFLNDLLQLFLREQEASGARRPPTG
jgi:coproporphyrinogen III oxidase-like Fe-S oxidoreductase